MRQPVIYTEKELALRFGNLVSNPATRVPICICLDCSLSMSMDGNIEQMDQGLALFLSTLRADEIASAAAEICIIAFGGDRARLVCDFTTVKEITIPIFEPEGDTPMGDAVEMALELLRIRKEEYKHAGIEYYQPWLVLISDGGATDLPMLQHISEEVKALVNSQKLYTIPIGIGRQTDKIQQSLTLVQTDGVFFMETLHFCDFFRWLSSSVSRMSMSYAGKPMPPVNISELGEWGRFIGKGGQTR